jgi:hypothetical protein
MDLRSLPDELWQECSGDARMRNMARHHHIFQHVFGQPTDKGLMSRSTTKNLTVSYGADLASEQVHRGNIMAAGTAAEPPTLAFSSEADELYTVMMVSPDGSRGEGTEVFAHWIV